MGERHLLHRPLPGVFVYRCDKCGAEFHGNESGLCPKCGVGIDLGNIIGFDKVARAVRTGGET